MSGVESETGSISPTMVANIVIDNIIVTPEINRQTVDIGFIAGSGAFCGRKGAAAGVKHVIV